MYRCPPQPTSTTGRSSRSFPERARLKGIKAIAFDVEHVIARPAKAQYETLMAALAAQPADVVLAEPLFLGAAFLLGHRASGASGGHLCGVIPLPVASRDTAPFGMGLPPARMLNRPRNIALAALNRRVLRRPYRVIDDLHRDVHGTALPGTFVDWGRRADALVQFTVPSFEYPRSDAPGSAALRRAAVRSGLAGSATAMVGRSRREPTRHPRHPGHVRQHDYAQVIAPTLRCACRRRCSSRGRHGRSPTRHAAPAPGQRPGREYLPYDELLPRTAVYVTNGGYGGVQYALRYGVPIVATGGKEDKPEVGARVAWSGVGRRIRSERPSPRALRRDILAVLNQPHYRQASRRVAADMSAAPGFAGLADIVDRLAANPTRSAPENTVTPR